MVALLCVAFIVAAAMQTTALLRYLQRASRDLRKLERQIKERGYAHSDWDDVDAQHAADRSTGVRRARRDFAIDTVLIGGGAAIGAVASIAALFVL